MGKWSELPPDILRSISLQIDNPFDLIHFRSVCSSWRSFSILKFRHMPPVKCPLPLDSGGYGDDCYILRIRVFLLKSSNSSRPKYFLFKVLENANGETCLHSLLEGRNPSDYNLCLSLNLLNCQIFELAQEHVAYSNQLCELIASVMNWVPPVGSMLNLKKNTFTILGKLSFEGLSTIYKRWTELEINDHTFIDDIVSFKGKFYLIERSGRTMVVEPTLEVTAFWRSRPCDKTRKHWLLKLGDKLLLVEMCTEKNRFDLYEPNIRERKIWFEISELDENRNDWDQVEDVGGRVLFLDTYCSFSCLATDIPGFRANSIIFMDMWGGSNSYEHESILVFEFKEHGVRSLSDIPEYIELFPTPPGWVISNE